MKFVTCLAAVAVAASLAACGGGGGSAGTTGSTSTDATAEAGVMTIGLVDETGAAVTDRSLSQTSQRFIKVTLKNSKAVALPFERVELQASSGADLVTIIPNSGALLTDSAGVALFKVSPSSVTASGAITLTASGAVSGNTLTQTLNLQTSPGSVALSDLRASPTTVQKGQSVTVSVAVKVNNATAPSNSVAVEFSSNCGTVAPTSALVDASGNASAVIQTTETGSCTVSAVATGGSNNLSSPFTVSTPPIAALRFISATPDIIFQSGSPGINTSQIKFRLLDTLNQPVQGQTVTASLSNTDGGINFCNGPSEGATDSAGEVGFSVCAGTLPTTVSVKASLKDSNPAISTNSNLLTIQTGLPTQRFFDISASSLNIYAGAFRTSLFSGNTTDITVRLADRQGNPVPNGTSVTFVSEGGQLNTGADQSRCTLTGGACTVQLIGQDYRPLGSAAPGGDPRPGRVTVLAYTDGEESFQDGDKNNRYDAGELFEDLGSPYIDKDESGDLLAAYVALQGGTNQDEQAYPLPAGVAGALGCPSNSNVGLSVQNTCNGRWDRLTKVRRSIVIVFSGGEIGQPSDYDATIPANKRSEVLQASRGGIVVRLADLNGNPLPSGSSIAVEVIDPDEGGCVATLPDSVIGNSTEPTTHAANLVSCNGDETVNFKVTVSSKVSLLSVRVP